MHGPIGAAVTVAAVPRAAAASRCAGDDFPQLRPAGVSQRSPGTVVFLASEDSGFTTGHYLPVNGRPCDGLNETAKQQDSKGGPCTVHTIDLAYVGRGIHEELVAHVADQVGR
jgi:hypothetical protein